MSAVTVRRAVVGDEAGIAHVQVTAWNEAYTGRMPQSVLDGLDEDRSATYWGHVLADIYGAHRSRAGAWVAERARETIGFASAGPCRDPDAVPGRTELYAIYVLAAHYGTPAGQLLLDAAIGDAAASLWVLEDNPRARAFYDRNGFVADGSAKDDTRWGDAIHEVRLVREPR